MPTLPVPLFSSVYKNVNGEELRDETYESYDALVTEKGGVVKRPGLLVHDTISANKSQATGLYWWSNLSRVIWVHGNNVTIYKEQPKGTFDPVAATDTIDLTHKRPTFATDGNRVFIANGGNLYAFNSAGGKTNVYTTDSDSPSATTHVGYLDGYILANVSGDVKFKWSDVEDYSSWSALSFASAIGNPDYVNALHVKDREIYLFGVNSVEIWENDGRTPFSRIPGGYLEVGTSSPYTVTLTENSMVWFESRRRVVEFSGRQIEYVSTPFDKEFESLPEVLQAYSIRKKILGQDLIEFHFPDSGKAYCWNRTSNTWGRLGEWNSQLPGYNLPRWGSYTYATDWGRHLAGDREDPTLYFTSDTYKDDNGTPIRLYRLTGHLDFGTSINKRATELRVRLRRGALSYSTTPKLMLRWRDNNRYWSQEHEIELGDLGETDIIWRIDTRGIFRTRQYEFSATDAVDIDFSFAEQDVEVLSN